ncbi:hypothetical protein C0Q70_00224 [Pomacea canaliculata]|uniref:Sulfotransferase domain-containing protein n=1 Tax=Pomacea canaliculata TaxID=400727 RepID=A0A2T7PW44_POMCA|nr:hypothetical protein C0Q70_00224 [Pomacea canaliculata]
MTSVTGVAEAGTSNCRTLQDLYTDSSTAAARTLMPRSLEGQLTMEKTPGYFITREVPKRVHNMSRDVKLLVVVRDPITRAISDYTQTHSKWAGRLKSFENMALLDHRLGIAARLLQAVQRQVLSNGGAGFRVVIALDESDTLPALVVGLDLATVCVRVRALVCCVCVSGSTSGRSPLSRRQICECGYEACIQYPS